MRSNCIVFAVALYLRRRRKGREGYLMMRRSRLAWGPHLLYAEMRRSGTLRLVSYKPTQAREKPLVPPLFHGTSRWGDWHDTVPHRRDAGHG